jgi:NADH-quinone oxidoreductase subunit H
MMLASAASNYVGDPLFAHGLNLAVWIILVVKTVAVFAITMVSVLFMVMYERKAVAWLGVRHGPNRAGPGGWLQSLADGTKLFFKAAFLPMLACSGVAVYGVMLAGWASGSKYPLLASVRASAQMVSYEAVLGLTVAAVVLETGSLHTSAIWMSQHGGFLYHWNIIRTGIIPFALFSIALTAEMTRAPFDLVEAEEELSGGFNLEYSSIGFAFFYLAEYANLVTGAAIITTLWLGGPDGPAIAGHTIGPIWFAIKVLILLYIFVWIRATLPRLRYDQLMELGWKRLIPLALAMLMIDAGFQVSRSWGFVAVGGSLLGFALLLRAIDVGRAATVMEATAAEGRPTIGAKAGS